MVCVPTFIDPPLHNPVADMARFPPDPLKLLEVPGSPEWAPVQTKSGTAAAANGAGCGIMIVKSLVFESLPFMAVTVNEDDVDAFGIPLIRPPEVIDEPQGDPLVEKVDPAGSVVS